jgi:hypothetical protein
MKKSFLLIISLIFLCSCASLSYQGKIITQKPIVLKDGKEVWKSNDLRVSYECQRIQDTLRISGFVELGNGISNNFSTIEYFRLQIHLVNAQGKISDTRLLADSGHLVNIEKWHFTREIPLPSGAEAMVFSYAGRAVVAGEDLTTWDFWLTP